MEIFIRDRGNQATCLENMQMQLLQISLIADNRQYAFNEVFHVHS
jgi:hypothetical protein